MKKLTVLLFVVLFGAGLTYGQNTVWQFDHSFTPKKNTDGAHGIATDPDGKIWVAPHRRSEPVGTGNANAIYVYNSNGTPASFSPIKILVGNGIQDTLLTSATYNKGLVRDNNGNIIATFGDRIYRINYLTGEAMNKAMVVAGKSSTLAGVDDLGEIFIGTVLNGSPIKIFNPDFSFAANAVDTVNFIQRSMTVTKDGNTIYSGNLSKTRVDVYYSAVGSLGQYALTADTIYGPAASTFAWHPKTGDLWFDGGNISNEIPVPGTGWTPLTLYGYNTATKTKTDSMLIDTVNTFYTKKSDVRSRGLAFSVSGDTAYLAIYNVDTNYVQVFRKVLTSVEPVDNGVASSFSLSQNYPNPFNPATVIEFALPRSGMTTLKVYDILGKEVATLVNENLATGAYKVRLDGSRLSSGTYIYTLVSGGMRISNKMLLVK